jgi:hypothetical protein
MIEAVADASTGEFERLLWKRTHRIIGSDKAKTPVYIVTR